MTMGETKEFTWDYSEYSDIFNIHKKGVQVKGSAELGDFSVDFDVQGNIVGLEIMNVVDFLQESHVTLQDLQELTSVELVVKQGRAEVTYIWVKLMIGEHKEYVLSVPAPVVEAI